MKRRLNVLNTSLHILTVLALAALVLLPGVSATRGQTSNDAAASDARLTVMSKELLEGISVAESLNVHGDLRAPEGSDATGVYQELFRVDTSAADSIAPASELERIGIVPVGQTTYTLADGTAVELPYGIARIEFMGEMKEGRVIFGPEDVQPTLGTSALEAIGFTVDRETQTLKRAPSVE